jgi:hypothetical protein
MVTEIEFLNLEIKSGVIGSEEREMTRCSFNFNFN